MRNYSQNGLCESVSFPVDGPCCPAGPPQFPIDEAITLAQKEAAELESVLQHLFDRLRGVLGPDTPACVPAGPLCAGPEQPTSPVRERIGSVIGHIRQMGREVENVITRLEI